MLHNHMFLIFISLVGGYRAGMVVNPAAAKYGRIILFHCKKDFFISGKTCVVTSCCYCLAPGYGGFGTQGNAAGKYGE